MSLDQISATSNKEYGWTDVEMLIHCEVRNRCLVGLNIKLYYRQAHLSSMSTLFCHLHNQLFHLFVLEIQLNPLYDWPFTLKSFTWSIFLYTILFLLFFNNLGLLNFKHFFSLNIVFIIELVVLISYSFSQVEISIILIDMNLTDVHLAFLIDAWLSSPWVLNHSFLFYRIRCIVLI